jgi:hypothetical protein
LSCVRIIAVERGVEGEKMDAKPTRVTSTVYVICSSPAIVNDI